MQKRWFMGLDQYGQTYHSLKHPRRDLMKQLGAGHAEKMFRDTKGGKVRHVGYVIQGLWIEVFAVATWKEAA